MDVNKTLYYKYIDHLGTIQVVSGGSDQFMKLVSLKSHDLEAELDRAEMRLP